MLSDVTTKGPRQRCVKLCLGGVCVELCLGGVCVELCLGGVCVQLCLGGVCVELYLGGVELCLGGVCVQLCLGVCLKVISIAVEVQVEMGENLSESEDVNNEEEWAEHRALGNTLCDCG